ncbi:hypothetical protein EJB05_53791, partial [Eragrostis curvula]
MAPGETVDALIVADAPPGKYYIRLRLSHRSQSTLQEARCSTVATTALTKAQKQCRCQALEPEMPDQNDTMTSFYFHGNLTSLRHRRQSPQVPVQVDERLFIVLGLGSVWKDDSQNCNRGGINEILLVATMIQQRRRHF